MDRRGEEKLASSRLPKFQHGKYDTLPTNQGAQKNIGILERRENVVFIKSYQLLETTKLKFDGRGHLRRFLRSSQNRLVVQYNT
jgi:hypothetical protein